MLIKFKKPDPRAGTVAKMDSSRGQVFVDSGAAVKLKDDGSDEAAPAPASAPAPEAAPVNEPVTATAAKTTVKAKK